MGHFCQALSWEIKRKHVYISVQFSSVTQSCPTHCDLMNSSTSSLPHRSHWGISSVQFSCSVLSDSLQPHELQPGLPVHDQLPEFAQTHVHRVGDAIQPSHPLSSPSPPAPIPPSIRVFSNESTLHMRSPKYWSFSSSIIPSKESQG